MRRCVAVLRRGVVVLSFCVLFGLYLAVVRVTFMPYFDNVKRSTMMVVKVVLVSFLPFLDVQRCVDRFAIFSALQQMHQIVFWVSKTGLLDCGNRF